MAKETWCSIASMDMGTFSVYEWTDIRQKLKGASISDSNWAVAAQWMIGRLRNRYVEPISQMPTDSYGPGFTIATVLCSLIEHFAALEKGCVYTPRKESKGSQYYPFVYDESGKLYTDFLRRAAIFEGYFFTQDGSPPPFCAYEFYKNVRCALVHEACTKNGWRINTLACGYENPRRDLFTLNDGVKRLYRDILVERIEKYMEGYLRELRSKRELQFALARKLDSLCEIELHSEATKGRSEWWLPPSKGTRCLEQ